MKKNEKKMKTFEKFFKCFKFLEKKLFSGRKNFHCQSFYYFVVLFFYSCIHVPTCCCVLHLLSRPNPPPFRLGFALHLSAWALPSAFGIFLPGFGQSPPRCGTQAKKSGAVHCCAGGIGKT
jgi:hypothetical protein